METVSQQPLSFGTACTYLIFLITVGPTLPAPPLHLLPKVAEKGQW